MCAIVHHHYFVSMLQIDALRVENFWLNATERSAARFTKYLTTILRLSYDNAKVTIDLRPTSNLQNILRRAQGFS